MQSGDGGDAAGDYHRERDTVKPNEGGKFRDRVIVIWWCPEYLL